MRRAARRRGARSAGRAGCRCDSARAAATTLGSSQRARRRARGSSVAGRSPTDDLVEARARRHPGAPRAPRRAAGRRRRLVRSARSPAPRSSRRRRARHRRGERGSSGRRRRWRGPCGTASPTPATAVESRSVEPRTGRTAGSPSSSSPGSARDAPVAMTTRSAAERRLGARGTQRTTSAPCCLERDARSSRIVTPCALSAARSASTSRRLSTLWSSGRSQPPRKPLDERGFDHASSRPTRGSTSTPDGVASAANRAASRASPCAEPDEHSSRERRSRRRGRRSCWRRRRRTPATGRAAATRSAEQPLLPWARPLPRATEHAGGRPGRTAPGAGSTSVHDARGARARSAIAMPITPPPRTATDGPRVALTTPPPYGGPVASRALARAAQPGCPRIARRVAARRRCARECPPILWGTLVRLSEAAAASNGGGDRWQTAKRSMQRRAARPPEALAASAGPCRRRRLGLLPVVTFLFFRDRQNAAAATASTSERPTGRPRARCGPVASRARSTSTPRSATPAWSGSAPSRCATSSRSSSPRSAGRSQPVRGSGRSRIDGGWACLIEGARPWRRRAWRSRRSASAPTTRRCVTTPAVTAAEFSAPRSGRHTRRACRDRRRRTSPRRSPRPPRATAPVFSLRPHSTAVRAAHPRPVPLVDRDEGLTVATVSSAACLMPRRRRPGACRARVVP